MEQSTTNDSRRDGKHRKILIFSVVLPADAPRIQSRLIPCLEAASFEVKVVSWRAGWLGIFSSGLMIWKLVAFLRKEKIDFLYCVDPVTLLFAWPLKQISSVKHVFYDRNERWPQNWVNRESIFQRFCSKQERFFWFFESILVSGSTLVTGTDLITLRQIKNRQKVVIPNRVFDLDAKNKRRNKSVRNRQSLHVAYCGSLSIERGWPEILNFVSKLGNENAVFLKTASRQKPSDTEFQDVRLNHSSFIPSKELSDFIDDCDFGVAYFGNEERWSNTVPSKISTYLQNGLPVVLIGSGRAARLLSKFYPMAFYLLDVEDYDHHELMRWLKNSDVNFRARCDPNMFRRIYRLTS